MDLPRSIIRRAFGFYEAPAENGDDLRKLSCPKSKGVHCLLCGRPWIAPSGDAHYGRSCVEHGNRLGERRVEKRWWLVPRLDHGGWGGRVVASTPLVAPVLPCELGSGRSFRHLWIRVPSCSCASTVCVCVCVFFRGGDRLCTWGSFRFLSPGAKRSNRSNSDRCGQVQS